MADRSKREGSSMDKKFRFSNTHTDFQARDAKVVFGWRYRPRIIFKAARASSSSTWTTTNITTSPPA